MQPCSPRAGRRTTDGRSLHVQASADVEFPRRHARSTRRRSRRSFRDACRGIHGTGRSTTSTAIRASVGSRVEVRFQATLAVPAGSARSADSASPATPPSAPGRYVAAPSSIDRRCEPTPATTWASRHRANRCHDVSERARGLGGVAARPDRHAVRGRTRRARFDDSSKSTSSIFTYTRRYQYVARLQPSDAARSRSQEVRRALNAAIDRDALGRQNALNGHGIASSGPVWPQHWALRPTDRHCIRSEAAARRLDARQCAEGDATDSLHVPRSAGRR